MNSNTHITIAGRRIGPDEPPYVIAELSGNHNGEIERAIRIIEAAKDAGADAVKLQTYTADTMTIDHDGPEFLVRAGPWKGRRLYELYEEAHTPWAWHEPLFAKGREIGITVFSTPFDASALDFLESLDAPAYKIASFELIDIPLIKQVARAGKPLILSTGMASLDDITQAVHAARNAGNDDIILLHCVSAYPAPAEEANLRTIPHMAETFRVPIGLSDHTKGIAVAIAATAFGACLIEKHFTLSRADGGVDSAFSLEPAELKDLVTEAKLAHAALGTINYAVTDAERGFLAYRRSIYVVKDIPAGEKLTEENIRVIRPALGLSPNEYPDVLGHTATRDLKRGEPLSYNMME